MSNSPNALKGVIWRVSLGDYYEGYRILSGDTTLNPQLNANIRSKYFQLRFHIR